MQRLPNTLPNGVTRERIAIGPIAREFLTFRLGSEEYGIEILKVQEIRTYVTATAIANAPPFIKGVVNLRGSIVPIIDMRIRFNLEHGPYDDFTVVVMLSVARRVIGMVVDAVSDVVSLSDGQIQPVPEFSSSTFDTRHIIGLGAVDDRMLILIDIEKLMAGSDMALMDAATLQ